MTKKDALLGAIIGAAIALLIYPIAHNLGFSFSLPFQAALTVALALLTPAGIAVAAWLARRWAVILQVAKYGAVGVLNTLIDAGMLNLLSAWSGVYSGTPIILYNSIGFSVAVVNSYFWNRYWVFASRDTQYGKEFVQFVIVSAIGLGLNTGLVYLLTTFVTPFSGLTPQVWENVAKAIAIPLSFAWNFAGYKFIVFRQ